MMTQRSQRTAMVSAVAAFFVAALALHLSRALAASAGAFPRSTVAFGVVIVGLYGVLTLLALARRPGDPRVGVFATLGVLISLTMVFPPLDRGWPAPIFIGMLFLNGVVYFGNFAVVIHMAALIPRRHPATVRHPALLVGNYILAGAAVIWAFVVRLPGTASFVPAQWHSGGAITTVNRALYLWAGVACLTLLGTAARGEGTLPGRRQALVVCLGVLPWTAVQVATLLLPPGSSAAAWLHVPELLAILLVPVCFFIAIFGFRLFDLELIARRGLIYGLTLAIPGVALGLAWIALGEVTRRAVGMAPTALNIGLVLLAVGAALRPLVRRVTGLVDMLFFPEKVALRRLERSIIPEMAEFTDLDAAAGHLVRRLRDALALESVALLVGDEDQRFYRVRAAAGAFGAGEAVRGLVVDRDTIGTWPGLAPVRPASQVLAAREAGQDPGSLGATLAWLEAKHVVPIRFKDRLIALLTLGTGLGGAGFDRDDLERIEIVAQLVSAMLENARLFELASKDPLTGLPRRQVFAERFAGELNRDRRTGRQLAVGMVDIDDFKRLNDTFGHLVGDRVLGAVAVRLAQACRSTDLVARYGGDEFVVLLPETERQGAATLGETLRRAVADMLVEVPAAGDLRVTVSIGMHVAGPDEATLGPDAIVHLADESLYRAKRDGKNRVEVSG
ncbi:MAG: GGDEF domain-containing protein [Acidobacteriia bacterium]|nr:GGDEF domain-containing protein [Terriglobia bacterium]